MLDWSARIDDLADRLAREWAMDDREVIEILLAALVSCPRTASIWLILETNWYSRECLDAWFSFGEQWVPCSLPRLRARNPWREVEAETKEWLENCWSEERLFIEPDYEKYPRFFRLSQSQYLLQRSLRIRTRSPRAADPLRSLDKRDHDRRADELNAATRYVLEDRVQARPPDPPRFVEPENFLYHVELVQRLAPWYIDWHTLVKAFALIAVRHAYLLGRTETSAKDHAAMARVARDSIPPWIAKACGLLLESPTRSPILEKHMALEEKSRRTGYGAHRELVRLHRHGLIRWNKRTMQWEIAENYRQGIRAVLEAQAFRSVPAAARA